MRLLVTAVQKHPGAQRPAAAAAAQPEAANCAGLRAAQQQLPQHRLDAEAAAAVLRLLLRPLRLPPWLLCCCRRGVYQAGLLQTCQMVTCLDSWLLRCAQALRHPLQRTAAVLRWQRNCLPLTKPLLLAQNAALGPYPLGW